MDPLAASLLLHSSRLQLNLAQRTRALEGATFEVITADTEHGFIQACEGAGKHYAHSVKGKKKHFPRLPIQEN